MLEAIKKWFIKPKPVNDGIPINEAEIDSSNGEKPYFNRLYTFGVRGNEGEIAIYLIDPILRVKYPIVDDEGNFVNFPGIENECLVKPYYKRAAIAPTIGFRTEFERDCENGRLMVRWEVQPDGWYWADEDGYGAGNDLEITLYAYITEDGKFEAPFRIYEIGNVKYYGTDLEEKEKKEYEERQEAERKRVESGESADDFMRRLINKAVCHFIKMAAESSQPFFVCFDVPNSKYEAFIRLVGKEPEWSLYIDVKIRGTDRLYSYIYTKPGDGGRHSREWIIEELKNPDIQVTIFKYIKSLCERIDRD